MRNWIALGCIALMLPAVARAQSGGDRFEARVYRNAKGNTMPYRLFIPPAYDDKELYPLVIYLHGIDAVGSDNLKQISDNNYTGANVWTTPHVQAKHPCFVLAPQLPFGAVWATALTRTPTEQLLRVLEILGVIEREFNVDPQRIYVVGQSLGGFGTWSLAAARPEVFAAAVPVCGGGNATKGKELAKVPIWAFHAADDIIVSVLESKIMVDAVQKAGGNIKYTEYKAGMHNSWDRAFNDPELIEWVFSHKRDDQ